MRETWAIVAVAVLAFQTVPAGPAAAADVTLSVLGIEANEGAPDTLASALTDALRQRVSATKGFRLVPGRDLVEVKLVFSCPDEAPSCMAQAAKSLGATKVIFGGVKKSAGDSFVVTLKLLDAQKGVVDAWVAEQIGKAQSTAAALRAPVQKWFGTLTGQGAVGTLRIKADLIGASVQLDGVPVGTTGPEDLTVPNVAAGRHDVLVTKLGHDPVKRDVTVAAGGTALLEVAMTKPAAVPPAAAAPTSPVAAALGPAPVDAQVVARPGSDYVDSPRSGVRSAAWATLLTGVLGVGLGVKFSIDVAQDNKDLDPYRRFPCAQSKFGCNAQGQPQTRALTKEEVDYVNKKKSEAETFQRYQWISYGLGGALLATGGVLFYLGYYADAAPAAGAQRSGGAGATLRLLPAVSPAGAGLLADVRF